MEREDGYLGWNGRMDIYGGREIQNPGDFIKVENFVDIETANV